MIHRSCRRSLKHHTAVSGKALLLPPDRLSDAAGLLVSDSGHHRLVVLEVDLEPVRDTIGDGRRGLVDGARTAARFSEPQGLCLLPADVAFAVGYDVVVADTVNHALRGVRLDDLSVRTVAGTGSQRMSVLPPGATGATVTDLSSPWDVEWLATKQVVVVAMAGTHQLIAFDPVAATVTLFAGTGHEGLVDGEPAAAWFAQSSGLAVNDAGLWVADSETSALRIIDDDGVHTAIGKGLFPFGHRDGDAHQALLQHPLGVTTLPDASLVISDTYNGALRHFNPRTSIVSTMVTGLSEPSDAVVVGEQLVLVESAAHRLTAIGLAEKYLDVEPSIYETRRAPLAVAPGHSRSRCGSCLRLASTSTSATVRQPGSLSTPHQSACWSTAPARGRLDRTVIFGSEVTGGVLHVTCRAATCDDDVEHAACRLHQQDWGSGHGDRGVHHPSRTDASRSAR